MGGGLCSLIMCQFANQCNKQHNGIYKCYQLREARLKDKICCYEPVAILPCAYSCKQQ